MKFLIFLWTFVTRVLVQAVKRNIDRFPEDFMFQLNDEEFANLKSQILISSWGGSRRANPSAFTEQGVAMFTPLNAKPVYPGLSSVLRSKRAVQVNIEIMRAFERLRQMMAGHKELERRLDALEQKYDDQFRVVFDAIRALMKETEKPKRKIGFEVKEKAVPYKKKR